MNGASAGSWLLLRLGWCGRTGALRPWSARRTVRVCRPETSTRASPPKGTAISWFIRGSWGAPTVMVVWKPGMLSRVKVPPLVCTSVAWIWPTSTR